MTATAGGMRVVNETRGTVLAERAVLADGFFARFRGLMLRPVLAEGEGLLLRPCSSIHMLFMRFSIDAVFLDLEGLVVAVAERLRPWLGLAGPHARAHQVLEVPAGTAAATGTRVGDRCRIGNPTADIVPAAEPPATVG